MARPIVELIVTYTITIIHYSGAFWQESENRTRIPVYEVSLYKPYKRLGELW